MDAVLWPNINPDMSELIGSLNKIKESGLGIPQGVFPNKASYGTAFTYLFRNPL